MKTFFASKKKTKLNIYLLLDEPRICWQKGTSGELENSIQNSGDDGARQADYYSREARVLRFSREHHAGEKILHAVQALRGTADEASALRFRFEKHSLCLANAGNIKAFEFEGFRKHHCHESLARHELVEAYR